LEAPHEEHFTGASKEMPHLMQNLEPISFSAPHDLQLSRITPTAGVLHRLDLSAARLQVTIAKEGAKSMAQG
jgi:hypothetical protein